MGSEIGDTWEDHGAGFFKFAVKRALKQGQIVHTEGKLQFILYFSMECVIASSGKELWLQIHLKCMMARTETYT